MIDWFLAAYLLLRSLKSGTPNFWKMEGAQKVTFSVHNLYSQMHFWGQMCPGGHLKGFQVCLKRRSECCTRAKNHRFFEEKSKNCTTIFKKSLVFKGRSKIWMIILRQSLIFQRKIKDLHENIWKVLVYIMKIKDFSRNLCKSLVFSKENQRFQR